MNIFNNYFNSFINESVLDIPRNSLDPTVFEFPDGGNPIMHPAIKTQIMSDIDKLREIVDVVTYFVIGSILTKRYNPHSDIDVNVQIDVPNDRTVEQIHDLIKQLNGKLATGTTHPINYYIMQGEYNLDKTYAAYDVANEVWIKEPEKVDVEIQKYVDDFQNAVNKFDFNTAELRRDIIDFEEIKSLDKEKVKGIESIMQSKLKEIENKIETLVRSYKDIKTLRKTAFEKDMTTDEIRKYGKKNNLPENIIYKMLERYYYFDFVKKLKKLIEDDKITTDDIKDIKKAGQEFWK